VTAAIEVAQMPLSEAARKVVAADPSRIETVLTGGHDYEIVCTITPEKLVQFRAAAEKAGVAVTEIGSIAAGESAPKFLDRNRKALLFKWPSFSHF
jgi:thiamine-monophosphate kinase